MTDLKTGDEAPWFHLTDQNGNGWSLGDFADNYLVLFFYGQDDAQAEAEVEAFRQLHKEFKRFNAKVVGVSPDDPVTHDRFAAQFKLPFNLLADTELETSKLFGVLEKDLGRPKPTTFLIGPDGAVLRVYRAVKEATSHPLQALEDLKEYVLPRSSRK